MLVAALFLQLPLAAWADEDAELKPAIPAFDNTPPEAGSAGATGPKQAAEVTKTLTGEVETVESVRPAAGAYNVSDGPATAPPVTDNVGLQSRTATRDDTSPAFKLAIQKLAAKVKLNSDDYRSLGIGILGYEKFRPLLSFTKGASITDVYAGCPAAIAGIRVGDYEKTTDETDAQTDVHGLSMFICGLAGKPVTVTIERRWHELQFHLVRMNVEDIPDESLRRDYERMITRMGAKLAKAYPQIDPKSLGQ